MVRAALAGMAAAAAWAVAEPLAQRVFGTPYSDVRLLGALTPAGAAWRQAGTAVHFVNGALFGVVFGRLGGDGWVQGLVAAQLENLALWPVMAVMDRMHLDRRSGAWPPLFRSKRVLAYEVTMHALFGIVLGTLLSHRRRT